MRQYHLPPSPVVDHDRLNRESRRKLLLVLAGFAVVAFLVTELMHYLLVPDLGPYRERIMAEGASALFLGVLAAKLLQNAYRARQHAMTRLQVIAEVNHHVRNALEVICLSAYITRDEEAIRRITEGVNRIDWVLREVLPRENFPLSSPNSPVAGSRSVPGGGADHSHLPSPHSEPRPPDEHASCTGHNTH